MLGKNLHLCFTKKLNRTSSIYSSSSPITATDHHHNNHHKHKQDHPSSTSILFKNFNSLYDLTPDHQHHHSATTTTASKSNSSTTDNYFSSSDSDEYHHYNNNNNNNDEKETMSSTTIVPDFSKVLASQRFFFSSPGRTNSIIESSLPDDDNEHDESLSPSSLSDSSTSLIKGGIPFKTCSSDPYMDFRKSMQEMVESRDLFDVTENWDYLHQLLSSYLTLNPKHTHKFIIRAFAELLVTLMSSTSSSSPMKSDRNSDISDQCNSLSRQSV